MEKNYEFRKKLCQVHRPNRINQALLSESDECAVDNNWAIVLPDDFAADRTTRTAALDLQDYLQVSMGVSVSLRWESCEIREVRLELDAKISNRTDAFLLQVEPGLIKITGKTGKGVFAGCIYIEDMMNLCEAPFLPHGKVFCEPLIEARGVHSGFVGNRGVALLLSTSAG